MKLSLPITAVYTLLGGALLQASQVTGTPTTPRLSYLGTANITIAPPIPVGPGPFGNRNIFAVTGGRFDGPRITATVPAVGGDWSLGDPTAGNFYADVRYQMHTADGADILVEANGPQQPEGVVNIRVRFETGHPAYSWLNSVVSVGIVSRGPDAAYVIIDLWQMEAPATEGKGKGQRRL
ncbi:Feruloyl esterase [Madurella fahalii]|uniref:Feruloyl esterase n=1 Tax=Madurella fahalii TaxID=1157608 RepID=A0ABQ0GCZ4_9PEZI